MGRAMADAAYSDLLQKYQHQASGVRLIRRAVDKACRSGVLEPMTQLGTSPLEECEAIARVIYASATKQNRIP
jgi:hypothetical protein